jgi:hypothetical protein
MNEVIESLHYSPISQKGFFLKSHYSNQENEIQKNLTDSPQKAS